MQTCWQNTLGPVVHRVFKSDGGGGMEFEVAVDVASTGADVMVTEIGNGVGYGTGIEVGNGTGIEVC